MASQQNLLYSLGQNPVAGKMLTLLDFGSFLKTPRIVGKSSTHTVGVFSVLMPYTAIIRKISNFTNKIKNPLELRLAVHAMAMCRAHLLSLLFNGRHGRSSVLLHSLLLRHSSLCGLRLGKRSRGPGSP